MAQLRGQQTDNLPSVFLVERGDQPVDAPVEARDLPPRVRLALGTATVVDEGRVFRGHGVGELLGEEMSASQLLPFLPPIEMLMLFFYTPLDDRQRNAGPPGSWPGAQACFRPRAA